MSARGLLTTNVVPLESISKLCPNSSPLSMVIVALSSFITLLAEIVCTKLYAPEALL